MLLQEMHPKVFFEGGFSKSSFPRFQPVVAQRQFNGVEQCLIVHRFAEISHGHSVQCSVARLIGIVSGYDYYGHSRAGLGHPRLDLEAVHYRHVEIQHDAVGPTGRKGIKELGAGRKGFHVHTSRTY